MTTATLTDAATVTLAFPLAAAEGLRHAITLAIHERPTSERDMLASIYGALVNPQPPRAAPRPENERRDGMRGLREVAGREGARPEPVDVLAVMDRARLFTDPQSDGGEAFRDEVSLARAAIAELIEAVKAERDAATTRLSGILAGQKHAGAVQRVSDALARVGGGK